MEKVSGRHHFERAITRGVMSTVLMTRMPLSAFGYNVNNY